VTDPEVSVVIPTYRTAAMLPELHRRLQEALSAEAGGYEIVFVDDGCPEGSISVLRELAARDLHVSALALDRNHGQNRAVMAGLAHARGRYVVVMDADLQDPPEGLPLLLAELRKGGGAVFGGRRGRYESKARLVTSRIFKLALHLCSRRRIPRDAGLFVALSRETVERLLAFGHPDPYVVGLIARTGLPARSVPIERAPVARSGYTTLSLVRLAVRAARVTLGPIPRSGTCDPRSALPAIREYIGERFAGPPHPGLSP
jgi:glycosyltransferase involved in cell wall biosynthesis